MLKRIIAMVKVAKGSHFDKKVAIVDIALSIVGIGVSIWLSIIGIDLAQKNNDLAELQRKAIEYENTPMFVVEGECSVRYKTIEPSDETLKFNETTDFYSDEEYFIVVESGIATNIVVERKEYLRFSATPTSHLNATTVTFLC